MRAITSATLVVVTNIIGLSLGPLITGALSDGLRAAYGADGLRYAIMLTLIANVLSCICYAFAARFLPGDRALTRPEGD